MRSCVLDVIGSIPIKKVRPMDCQNCINRQAANSKYQINQTKQMLEFLFSHAIDNDLIIKNPVKNITMPDGSVEERRPLTDYEEQIFLSIDDKRFLLFRCMYYCGCRPSEVRSLEGRDIKEHDGVHILHIRGTKTDKSERYVPIPSELYDEIKGTPPFQKICLNASGRPFDEKAYQRAWNSLKREMNIKMGCKMYRNALIPPYPLAPDLVELMEKAETADVADIADAFAVLFRTVRMSAVFDDEKVVFFGDRVDLVHVGDRREKVNGDDRLGARGDRFLDFRRIDAESFFVAIDDDGFCAEIDRHFGGGDPRNAGDDHFVAGADAEGDQSAFERHGAVRHPRGVFTALPFGKFFHQQLFILLDHLAGGRGRHPAAGVHFDSGERDK